MSLGIAGGDGSLAPIAALAIETDRAFVCIPFGTRNHFARDLGLDRDDPLGALRAFDGSERRIDVGRAGDRLFLNNVSLGLYARLVHRREEHRRRREAFARIRAWAILVTHRQPLGSRSTNARSRARWCSSRTTRTRSSSSRWESASASTRASSTSTWLTAVPTSWDEAGERFVVDARAHQLEAAVDGEPDELKLPLEFEIEPRALRVLSADRRLTAPPGSA